MAFAHSRCTSCAAPSYTPQISRGDLFGIQCRYKPSPNILIAYSGNTSRKVELPAINIGILIVCFEPGWNGFQTTHEPFAGLSRINDRINLHIGSHIDSLTPFVHPVNKFVVERFPFFLVCRRFSGIKSRSSSWSSAPNSGISLGISSLAPIIFIQQSLSPAKIPGQQRQDRDRHKIPGRSSGPAGPCQDIF